jgi:Domain of unknown function (DUF4160)
MPEICRFYGIVIYMYYDDHEPPHFHANYQGYKSVWSIVDLRVLAGSLPPRIENLIKRWALEKRQELAENWERCKDEKQLKRISPL